MKHIRILALLLALITVLALLTSCKGTTEESPDINETNENGPEAVELRLVSNGSARYAIVYDYKADGKVIEACQALQATIRDVIGADIELRPCFCDRDNVEEDVVTENEILIGMTNRQESIDALKGLRSRDYVMGVYGNKLVIGSNSGEGTVTAVTQFSTQFVYKQGSRNGVRDGKKYSLVFSSEDNINQVGTYSYSVCNMLDARIDSYYLIYPSTDKTGEAKAFAQQLQTYISAETGYDLDTHRDNYWADYEILVGNTARSDESIQLSLADNEYYISLTAKKDGSGAIVGGTMQILYGSNAQEAAYTAFRRNVLPASRELLQVNLEDGLVFTNHK